MELAQLLNENWLNIVIIFVLPFVRLIYKKQSKNDYFDNVIKYTDILEKTPQPKYKQDYLSNIKKKLLWEKVCFYKLGSIEKDRIAISLVNADTNNMINLAYLNGLTAYFSIKKNKITPAKFFTIPEFIIGAVALFIAFIIFVTNLYTVFHSGWLITVLISILTILVLIITGYGLAITPIKLFKTYLMIIKDKAFLQRANNILSNIIKADEESKMIEETIEEQIE